MIDQQIVMIPLNHLTADEQYQARGAGLSEAHVRLLIESDPQDWPPVLVAPHGDGTYGLRDGFHRCAAASRLGLPALRCTVRDGAGYPDAVIANIAHGLPLSVNDRKEAARWWIETESTLSDREIGRRVGLNGKTVAKVRKGDSAPNGSARKSAPDPMERWLMNTYSLERLPNTSDVQREIQAYAEDDRSDTAKVYAAVGRTLIEASTPYLNGR